MVGSEIYQNVTWRLIQKEDFRKNYADCFVNGRDIQLLIFAMKIGGIAL